MQVAQDAGGGGSVRSSIGGGRVYPNALPIDDVLNNKVAFSLQIKEAPDLNGSSEASIVQQASSKVSQEASETNGLAESILARLESTNSKQYYTGPDAQAQVEKLKEIIDDMNGLSEALNKFAAYQFGQTAQKYNAALKKLKDCVDMKLLKELADEINSAAKSKQNWNGIGLKKQQMLHSSRDNVNVKTGEIDNGTAWATKDYRGSNPITNSKGEQTGTDYIYEYCEWRYINYWAIFKLDFWPFTIGDDDLPKLVQRFNNAGINPYQYIGR